MLAFLLIDVVEKARILVGEAVVILLPDMRGEDVVQRRDLPAPGQLRANLQPLGVLAEHRVDDANEGLVAVEQPVATGQQVSLQPALALVLAEHRVENLAGRREELVVLSRREVPLAVGDFEDRLQEIRDRLVGAEEAEIALLLIQPGHVAQEAAEHERVLTLNGAGGRHLHRVVVEVRHPQVSQQDAAVGVRVGAHPPVALRRQLGQLRNEPAILVEELLWPVALHPAFELLDVIGMIGVHQERHLVRSERAFNLQAVYHLRPGPALRRPQDDHRPALAGGVVVAPSIGLDAPDLLDGVVQGGGHEFMHRFRLIALDEVGRPAAAPQELFQLVMLDACQNGRVADLVAVQVQDRQDGAVA